MTWHLTSTTLIRHVLWINRMHAVSTNSFSLTCCAVFIYNNLFTVHFTLLGLPSCMNACALCVPVLVFRYLIPCPEATLILSCLTLSMNVARKWISELHSWCLRGYLFGLTWNPPPQHSLIARLLLDAYCFVTYHPKARQTWSPYTIN